MFFSLLLASGCIKKTSNEDVQPKDNTGVKNTIKEIGGDKDENNCIASAGYSWCEAKEKCLRVFEEFCPDEVTGLVDSIKKESDVELVYAGEKTFNWIAGNEDAITDAAVSGVSYSANGVSLSDYNKVEQFFNNNYEMDNYNIADGVAGGLRGYYVNYLACNLNFRHAEMKENSDGLSEPVGDNIGVTLDCGYFNKNDIPELISEQLIKEILAKKYKKAVDELKVNILKSDDVHVAGSVIFNENSSGEGGMFLAVLENNVWQVVFDGNGSVDCEKMRSQYGFSNEILQPNFCD